MSKIRTSVDITDTPIIPNIEERRLSCSRTEFRPIHSEIIRRNIVREFQGHASLPHKIKHHWSREDVSRCADSGYQEDSLASLEHYLLTRRKSVPISMKNGRQRNGRDSGIGSSPDKSPDRGEPIFDMEMDYGDESISGSLSDVSN